MTQLFSVNGADSEPVVATTLQELGLHERSHLQEWVMEHPQVLGDDVLIVTSEYDRWAGGGDGARARDRLDVLGLEASGRLVVVELKRGAGSRDVHLQAITYAAMVSRFGLEELASALAAHRSSRGEPTTAAGARRALDDHLGDRLDVDLLRRPKIVLVAEGFPDQVISSAVWLSEMGVDIELIEVTAWRIDTRPVVGFSKVYPTPQVEEFVLRPAREESTQVSQKVALRSRMARTVSTLVSEGLIEEGTPLILTPVSGANLVARNRIRAWVEEAPERGRATWRNDPVKPIIWEADGEAWAPTALAQHVLFEATGTQAAIRGPQWWALEDGTDLVSLAGVSAVRDWSDLHDILDRLPAGRWTTYGDLAAVVGTAAQPLGRHVAQCPDCHNAHRVLRAGGGFASDFHWDRAESPQAVLEAEGVVMSHGVADPSRRLDAAALRRL